MTPLQGWEPSRRVGLGGLAREYGPYLNISDRIRAASAAAVQTSGCFRPPNKTWARLSGGSAVLSWPLDTTTSYPSLPFMTNHNLARNALFDVHPRAEEIAAAFLVSLIITASRCSKPRGGEKNHGVSLGTRRPARTVPMSRMSALVAHPPP
ncbi:hypothetical protein LZ30DRAFT_715902 [Colletotrichum cereale]|nr:hypothetical protein LZ30DRAFT_715902 [Colletotrichum cereale]